MIVSTMSLIPPGTSVFSDIDLYTSTQVAVTCAVLYDHALSLGREVELIWMKPPSSVTVLYVIERYLGDVVLIAGLCLCFSVSDSREECVDRLKIGIRLFEFRAWGALVYSWATQATMQLRIYAMYRQSRRVLALLLVAFSCEITAIAFIIWQTIGPHSPLQAIADLSGQSFCAFSGINAHFVYIFIPFLCFETLLFVMAARVFVEDTKRNKLETGIEKGFQMDWFVSVLARDSLCYFFVNVIACAVVMGLWQTVTELYANICIPFVMLLEVLVGTRFILDFRERYSGPDAREAIISGNRCNSQQFRREDLQMDTSHLSVRCRVETVVVTDA